METELSELQKRIGYTFKDHSLIYEALSHSSYANEKKKERNSNERLEFLGDSVLSVVVSQYLFEHYRNLPEGELTKIRAALVCEKSLHKFALKIGLGDFLLLGEGGAQGQQHRSREHQSKELLHEKYPPFSNKSLFPLTCFRSLWNAHPSPPHVIPHVPAGVFTGVPIRTGM